MDDPSPNPDPNPNTTKKYSDAELEKAVIEMDFELKCLRALVAKTLESFSDLRNEVSQLVRVTAENTRQASKIIASQERAINGLIGNAEYPKNSQTATATAGIESIPPINEAQARPSTPFTMSRHLVTVPQAWQEWFEGINGRPSIVSMDEHHKGWRSKDTERKFYSSRKVIIDKVKELVDQHSITVPEAIERLEQRRGRKSLNFLMKSIKAEARSARSTTHPNGSSRHQRSTVTT